jgi:hypothetical protein
LRQEKKEPEKTNDKTRNMNANEIPSKEEHSSKTYPEARKERA